MKVKTFSGRTVNEAIKAVKMEFGENALILNTKKASKNLFEVSAAIDYELSEPENLSRARGDSSDAALSAAGASFADSFAAAGDDYAALVNEVRELKDLCWSMMGNSRNIVSEAASMMEKELEANGVDRTLARKVITSSMKAVSGEQASDRAFVELRVRDLLSGKISVSDPVSDSRVVAFVGPTGVGKTTTVAKLAAIHALKKKRKVALLTMDTYRIAAAEQLRTYAKIIGVPVEVASSHAELAGFIGRYTDRDLILIDTAGRSRDNTARIEELNTLGTLNEKVSFNLVLSNCAKDSVNYESIKGFKKALPIDSLTFTKLDESASRGSILNTAILAGMPVSYLTTGQRVPEDIELASKDRILDFLSRTKESENGSGVNSERNVH